MNKYLQEIKRVIDTGLEDPYEIYEEAYDNILSQIDKDLLKINYHCVYKDNQEFIYNLGSLYNVEVRITTDSIIKKVSPFNRAFTSKEFELFSSILRLKIEFVFNRELTKQINKLIKESDVITERGKKL